MRVSDKIAHSCNKLRGVARFDTVIISPHFARLNRVDRVNRSGRQNDLHLIFVVRFPDLPAPVYVRGFVGAYASCLGLDSRRVATSYMRRFDARREERRKGRFFESH